MGIQLRQSPSGDFLLGSASGQVPVWNNDTNEWEVSDAPFTPDFCSSVSAFTSAAIQAALDAGTDEVCFPPGTYAITTTITQSRDEQALNFSPGAVLLFAAGGAGKLVVNGLGARITGNPTARWSVASTATYVAIDLHGAASQCDQMRFELNADVPNCTLLRLSGTFSAIGPTLFTGTGGSFKYGVEMSQQDGTVVHTARSGRMTWEMTDDGVQRNFSALLRYRSTLSQGGPISISIGGRQFFNAIVEVDGAHNSLLDPQIKASAASNYGILLKDDSEFFDIYDGEISGNFLANSVGIACGDGSKTIGAPATGQLKCYGTRITNWDVGVRITGTSDTPSFFGATIANNKTAQVVIDSKRDTVEWPVSGLSFFGCYSEEAAFPGVPFLWLKTGVLAGGFMAGCEIGITGTAVLVESTMGSNGMQFDGNRFPMASGTDAITTPNASSSFYFGLNSLSGSNSYGKGTFAAKAIFALDPVLQGLVVGTKDPAGTSNNHITRIFTDIYTANFGSVGAGATVVLFFNYPGVPTSTTAGLCATMGTALGVKIAAGILFQWWIDVSGFLGGSATNITGSTINAVSGGIRFEIVVYG